MTQTTIEFFFDTVSPYSYLAAERIGELEALNHVEVVWRPFFLGALFAEIGNKPPATIPGKGMWMLKDLHMWAKKFETPFALPASFPCNSLKAQRACLAAQRGGKCKEVATALFRMHWAEGGDLADPAVVARALEVTSVDAGEIMEAIQVQDIKDELKKNTAEAVRRGVFGAPTFFVNGDEAVFWGNDRIDLLLWYLQKG